MGGPLILGATGRVGRAFQALAQAGHWPGATPLWHGRQGGPDAYGWDMLAGPAPDDPRLADVTGVILLAGATSGSDAALATNTALAHAALGLVRDRGLWPLLIASTGAVYGRATGPQVESATGLSPNAYGQSKRAMEQSMQAAIRPGDVVTCLRIGNVAGSDALFRSMAHGPVKLDRFADGHGPRRAYVGPLTLAQILQNLIATTAPLPSILNVAAPGTVAMSNLLLAANHPFDWQPAPDTALPELALDVSALARIIPLSPDMADPARLVAEARQAGWPG